MPLLVCPHCRAVSSTQPESGLLRCEHDAYALVTLGALEKGDGDPLLGATLRGGFVPLGLASTGSTAAVYFAKKDDGSKAALKVLRFDGPLGEESHDIWTRELTALRQIESPFVVRTLGAGHVASPAADFLALEWLDGDLLKNRLRFGAIDLGSVAKMVVEICSGLECIHSNGLVHGDVSSSNVMVTDAGSAKLFDLGSSAAEGTVASAVTPSATAPEQWSGQSIDRRADLYAVGCLLFRMMTGEPPFVGSVEAVRRGHLELGPDPPSHRGSPRIPTLDALVLGLLAKRPEDRPRAREVIEALQTFQAADS